MLSAQAISVRKAGKALLDQVSLTVWPGELLAVIGPNGAGKSTALKALCGDVAIMGGAVVMNGRPLSDWPLRERANVRAVLPQDSSLDFPFTALDVALMGRTAFGAGDGALDYEIARQALAAAEVAHLEQRTYPTLSGGERQRVQLARVLAQIWEPPTHGAARYLLLDEPTASLDLTHQHAMLALARRFARHGVGVLALLHDLNLAAAYADRIAVLKDGQLIALDTPTTVLQPELIKRVFGMTAQVLTHTSSLQPLVVPIPVNVESLS